MPVVLNDENSRDGTFVATYRFPKWIFKRIRNCLVLIKTNLKVKPFHSSLDKNIIFLIG